MKHYSQLRVRVVNLPPEGVRVIGSVPFERLDIADDVHIACPNDMSFTLHVQPVRQGILVRGVLQTVLQCRCDRCLKSYERPVTTDDVCHFFVLDTFFTTDLVLQTIPCDFFDHVNSHILFSFYLLLAIFSRFVRNFSNKLIDTWSPPLSFVAPSTIFRLSPPESTIARDVSNRISWPSSAW